MIRASECHSLNGHYGLRRIAVLPKRLQDYYVEGLSLSKKKCVHTMTNGANGHSSTVQAPLHQPVSTEATCNSSCGPLILRIKRTGLPGSRCGFISEFVIPSSREEFRTTVGGSKPTQPLISRNEQADVAQAAETGVGSQVDKEIPVVPKAPLQETLEIASILLSLGQPVHQQNTAQQGEPTSQAAPVAQHGKFRVHQDHTYCKQHAEASAISGYVDSSEAKGRRKKLVNPCHIVPCEVQNPALHVQLSGPQNVCRSGLDIQPGGSGGDTACCETKGRRRKQAKPLCAMPSKVQKQAPKALNDLQAAPVCSQASFAGLPYSLNEVLGIPQTPCHGFIGDKDQHDQGGKFSPQDINIPFEWSSSPREREDMFFPHLDDSSYKAEAVERKRREAALQSSLRQLKEPLDERYIKNAAVLPDLRQPTSAPASIQNPKPSFSNGPQLQEEPLRIHGYNVEDFKRIYHSVVDPKLTTKSGNACRYDLQMGRVIKQRMWEKFNCPSFVETVDADGRVQISESYCSPTLKPHAPVFEVDISEEPLPEQPKRKRARR